MALGSNKILGLAMGDREISCALVSSSGGRHRVLRLATFQITGDATATTTASPDQTGRQLRQFLKDHEMSATHAAVVGVPAKWVIAQEREVPPADERQAVDLLRLQAERLAIADGHDLVFDYAGDTSRTSASRVMLVGMLRPQLDRITQLCASAGVKPVAITPTALACACAVTDDARRPVVIVSSSGAEVAWQCDSAPRMLRALATSGGGAGEGACKVTTLGGELRRTFGLLSTGGDQPRQIVLWNGGGELSGEDLRKLSQRVGWDVAGDRTMRSLRADVEPKALNGATGRATPESFLPAVALAIAGNAARPPVDLLHTRLAPPKVARVNRAKILAIGAIVLALALLGQLYLDVRQTERMATELEAKLTDLAPEATVAQARVDRMSYGRGYYEKRPPVLDVLRGLSQSVEPDEPIWATSLTLRETGRGQVQGKAANQRVVLAVLDRIKASDDFQDVQLMDLREAVGTSGEVAFSIGFTFARRD